MAVAAVAFARVIHGGGTTVTVLGNAARQFRTSHESVRAVAGATSSSATSSSLPKQRPPRSEPAVTSGGCILVASGLLVASMRPRSRTLWRPPRAAMTAKRFGSTTFGPAKRPPPRSQTDSHAVWSPSLHSLARESVVEQMRKEVTAKGMPEKAAVIFVAGGPAAVRHETDHEDIFRQESTFHYLFGVREPGYFGAIDVNSGKSTLFAPRLPEEYALWMGEIQSTDQICAQYGVDEVVYADEVSDWFERRESCRVHLMCEKNSDSGQKSNPADFKGLRDSPKFEVDEELLHQVVYECRLRKNKEELDLLRYVNRISSDAHIDMMRMSKPGLYEYQLESTFAHSCYFNGGCRLTSYTPIAGSGPNSAVLHYGHAGAPNERRMEDGDMVLCDMGAEFFCYASDITNSFPANGKFTPDQRIIFVAVAEMQKAVLEAMKPGVKWVDMHDLAYRVLCEHLLAAGLLVAPDIDTLMAANVGGVLMPHGLGHLMGIDTHDVGGYPPGAQRDGREGYKALRMQRLLEPGMVLTVEPGIYFAPYALKRAQSDPVLTKLFNWSRVDEFRAFGGVRLEDNVLVTDDGIENLTIAPRTVEEVEAVMRGEIADAGELFVRRQELTVLEAKTTISQSS